MSQPIRKSSRCRHLSERAKESIAEVTPKRSSKSEGTLANTTSEKPVSEKPRTRSRKRSAGEQEPVAKRSKKTQAPAQAAPKALVIQTGDLEDDFQRPHISFKNQMKEERRRRLLALREMQMLNSVVSVSESESEDDSKFDYRNTAVFSDDDEDDEVEPLDALLKQFAPLEEENIMSMPVESPLSDHYSEDWASVTPVLSDKITKLLKDNNRWPLSNTSNSSFDMLGHSRRHFPEEVAPSHFAPVAATLAEQQQQDSLLEEYFEHKNDEEDDGTPSLVSDKSRSSSPTLDAFAKYPHQLDYRYHGQANLALVDPEQIELLNSYQPPHKALNKRSLISGSAYTQLVDSSIEISDFLL